MSVLRPVRTLEVPEEAEVEAAEVPEVVPGELG